MIASATQIKKKAEMGSVAFANAKKNSPAEIQKGVYALVRNLREASEAGKGYKGSSTPISRDKAAERGLLGR